MAGLGPREQNRFAGGCAGPPLEQLRPRQIPRQFAPGVQHRPALSGHVRGQPDRIAVDLALTRALDSHHETFLLEQTQELPTIPGNRRGLAHHPPQLHPGRFPTPGALRLAHLTAGWLT
jgi:hypothetical protein